MKARFWLEAKRTIPLGTVNELRAKPAGFSAAEQALTQASRASVVRASWPPAAIDLALDYGNNKTKSCCKRKHQESRRRREANELSRICQRQYALRLAKKARKPRGRKSRDDNRQSPDLFHRNAFGEVAGFINVAAQLDSEMVGE